MKRLLFISGFTLMASFTAQADTFNYPLPTTNDAIKFVVHKKDSKGNVVFESTVYTVVGQPTPMQLTSGTDQDGDCIIETKRSIENGQLNISELFMDGNFMTVLPLKKDSMTVDVVMAYSGTTYDKLGEQKVISDTCKITNAVGVTTNLKWQGYLKYGKEQEFKLSDGYTLSLAVYSSSSSSTKK